tara:strand:+ start:637 stop:1854 length:1218 start_codon:yes stop_codon:yes gene_type:complete
MCFTTPPVELSGSGETLAGTQLPEWVSQAGKAIFQQAATLVQPEFDDEGNYIPDDGYLKKRQADYINTAYDYDGDGQITEADATAATAAGDTGKAGDITQGLASGLGIPGSKLSLEEQEAGRMLTEGATQYQGYLTGFDTDGDGVADTQSSQTFMDDIGQGYLGTKDDGSARTYQDLSGELMGEDFAIGEGTEAQKFLDIYSEAMNPAIRDIQDQTLAQQNAARATAAKSGAFGGSRLGIQEAMLGSEGIQSQADLRARGLAEGLGFAAGRFDADRAGRMAADSAARGAYETEESGRLQAAQQYQNLATLTQGLQQQAAAGLISTGEAKRLLDQQALDLAYSDYLDTNKKQYEDINFALGALQGVPYNTQQYGYNTQTQQQLGPSVYGQTLGALGTLGSAYYMGK